jgi:hypothetical protein
MSRRKQPSSNPLPPERHDAAGSKLLKRTEAARVLGVSVSTLRRHEGTAVTPIVGANGVHLFEEAELRSVKITVRRREAFAALGTTSGDVAADVFELLDQKVHPVDIVKRLRLPPDAVATLLEQWAQLRGGFVVNADEAQECSRLLRGAPIASGRDATRRLRARIDALGRLHDSPRCASCGEKAAIACEACVLQRRGPLTTLRVRLERRTDEQTVEWVRVVAEVVWDDTLAPGDMSDIVTVHSEWFRSDAHRSPIADVVEALAPPSE